MMKTAKKWLSRVMAWCDELLFPQGVTCLCCARAPKHALEDGLCESCAAALDVLRAQQEQREQALSDLPQGPMCMRHFLIAIRRDSSSEC